MNRTSSIDRLRQNQINIFDRVLSRNECNRLLLSFDNRLWERSAVMSIKDGKKLEYGYSNFRTSNSLFFPRDQFNDVLLEITTRVVSRVKDLNPSNWEPWQVTRYYPGQYFEPHLDSHSGDQDPEGPRTKTILLYLQAPLEGGETYFRALNLWIKPVPGRLVVWDNLLATGNPNFAMIHSGEPVVRGIKVILQTWQRQSNFKHSMEAL
jgi:prolyl 4-hydroxylase